MKFGPIALIAGLLLAGAAQGQSYSVNGTATPTGAPGTFRGYDLKPADGQTPTTAPVVSRHYDVYSATGSTPLGGTSASPQADARACCGPAPDPTQAVVTAQGRNTVAQKWSTPAMNYHCLPSYNSMYLESRGGGTCTFTSEVKSEACQCGTLYYKVVHQVTMPSFSANDYRETVANNCTPCPPPAAIFN